MSSDPISVTKASRCVGQIGRADGNPGKTYHTSSYQTRPTDLQETASNVSHRYVENSLSKVGTCSLKISMTKKTTIVKLRRLKTKIYLRYMHN